MTNNVLVSNDSIPMVVNGVISEQYEQSLRLDTLSSRVDSIMEMAEQFGQSTQLDTILSRLETIMEYGIGYHDAAEHIVLPLLIALFAFSFTFLFPAINHINNKYNSPRLSFEFSHSFPYIFYWTCTILDVTTLVAYGFLSLLCSDSIHPVVMRQTWILLIVAVVYSFAIVRFVLYCIQFNKPSWLLQKVDTKDEIESKSSIVARKIAELNYRIDLDKSVNMIDQSILGYLPDLFRYAITNNDMQLFDSVMEHVSHIVEMENKIIYAKIFKEGSPQSPIYAYYSTLLLDSLFGIYVQLPANVHVESLLIRNKLNSHSHRYHIEKLSLAPILKMADFSRKSMIDNYVEMSSNLFSFISLIPLKKYVQGAKEEEIKRIEDDCCLSWKYVRCAHFFLTAYWFAKDQYSFMNTLHNNSSFSIIKRPLYPFSNAGIISCYMNCLNIIEVGGGQYVDMVDGVRITVTRPILERYTAALLLFVFDKTPCDEPISETLYEAFKNDYMLGILKYCEELKNDEIFISRFPSVKKIDIDYFKSSLNSPFIHLSDVDYEMKTLQSFVANNNTIEFVVNHAKDLWNFIEIDANYTNVPLGKLSVFKPKDYHSSLSYVLEKQTQARAFYIMLSAYYNMKLHTVKTNRNGFDNCLKKITKNNVEGFILIDLDSQVGMFYSQIKSRYILMNAINWPEEVKDSVLYDEIGRSMLVINKKDRPIIMTDGETPELIIENESLSEKNLYYHIFFNPHLVVKFNKDADVYRIIEK